MTAEGSGPVNMSQVEERKEDEFYRILDGFLDLERNTARKYTDAEYNLLRMPQLAALFGHPELGLRIIHVAGTKGKGSVCHYTTALLGSAGRRVGTFTSPHLRTFRERFLIDGQLPDWHDILSHTESVAQRIRASGIDATFFEVLTVLALSFFAAMGCEWVVLETGIGGRLDCTNFVAHPDCTAITAISYDHQALLGTTIEAIAAEKAGIIKPGVPVVCGHQPFPEAEHFIRARAAELASPFIPAQVAGDVSSVAGMVPFQKENLAVAATVCRTCDIAVDLSSFSPPPIPGRFQCLRREPLVLIDAAHNADSARRLVEAVQWRYPGQRFTCVVGVTRGKDAAGILRELAQLTKQFILTNPRLAFKGSELPALETSAVEAGLDWTTRPEITSCDQLPQGIPLLFTGSFFTASIGAEMFGENSTEWH